MENENFTVRAPSVLAANFVWNWTPKIYLIGSNVSYFEKRKKVLNHSTLIYSKVKLLNFKKCILSLTVKFI